MFVFVGCASKKSDDTTYTISQSNYVGMSMEYLESIGLTFYDKQQIVYCGDSTYIVFPDGFDLVFYHLESKKEANRIKFSINIENSLQISADSPRDAAVLYGNAVLRVRDGVEEIHELGDGLDGMQWGNHSGFEYFANLDKVVLGLKKGSWPGEDSLKHFLSGLGEYDLTTRASSKLPFQFSEIYRKPEFWSSEYYVSRSDHRLVVSENWGEEVYVIDMKSNGVSRYTVKHSTERIKDELPSDLSEYPHLIPKDEEQKTEKYALWELRHYYFEKYTKALMSVDGKRIYRIYYHRIPVGYNVSLLTPQPRHQRAVSIVQYDLATEKTKEYILPANHYYVLSSFWLSQLETIDHIKFHYTSNREVDDALYFLERLEFFDI